MILPEQKVYEDLVKQFCSRFNLGKPPAKLTLHDKEEYLAEVRDVDILISYNPEEDWIALSPIIFEFPGMLLHELYHHFQVMRYGTHEFNRKYDEYLETHGYEKHPYELEAEDFEKKWWPDFATLIREKLGG